MARTKTLKVVISGDPSGVKRAFGETEKAGGKLSGFLGSVGSKIAKVFKGLAITVGATLTAALAKAVTGGFQRLMALEDAEKMLEQMGLSAQESGHLMDSLNDTLTGTAFSLDQGASAMTGFVSAGMSLDEVANVMDLVADAAAFGQADLGEVSNLFQRIQLNGKATTEVLQSLNERGIPAFAMMSDALGMTGEEFQKFVSDGNLSAELFFETWEKGAKGFGDQNIVMEGAAKSMGDTTRGAWANTMAALSRFGAILVGPIFKALPAILGWITEGLKALGAAVGPMVDEFLASDQLAGWIETARGGFERLQEVAQSVWDWLSGIDWGAVFAQVSDIVSPVIDGLQSVADSVLNLAEEAWPMLQGAIEAAWPVLEEVADVAGEVLGVALDKLGDAIDWVADNLDWLGPIIGGAVAGFIAFKAALGIVALIKGVTTAIALMNAAVAANPVMLLVIAIGALVGALIWAYQNVDWFRAAVDAFAAAAVAAFQWVWEKVQAVFSWVSENWPLLLAILTGPIGMAVYLIVTHWNTISNAFTAVKEWIGQKVGEIVGFITGIPGRIGGVVSTMWNGLTSGITAARDWVSQKVEDIAGFFSGLPGRIGGFFSGLANTISGPFKSGAEAIRSVWNSTIGGKGVSIPDIPGLPGRGQRFEIPRLHTGGTFRAPTAGGEGWAVLRDGERVLTPNQMGPPSRGGVTYVDQGTTVQVTVHGSVLSERDLVDVVRDGLLRKQATSGRPILPGVA